VVRVKNYLLIPRFPLKSRRKGFWGQGFIQPGSLVFFAINPEGKIFITYSSQENFLGNNVTGVLLSLSYSSKPGGGTGRLLGDKPTDCEIPLFFPGSLSMFLPIETSSPF